MRNARNSLSLFIFRTFLLIIESVYKRTLTQTQIHREHFDEHLKKSLLRLSATDMKVR